MSELLRRHWLQTSKSHLEKLDYMAVFAQIYSGQALLVHSMKAVLKTKLSSSVLKLKQQFSLLSLCFLDSYVLFGISAIRSQL